MTVDLNVPAQRHADVKNGLTVPPRLTFKTAADMIWRVPWAVSMLRTRHKTFGNLSGYSAAGVDMNNLASWIGSQVLLSAKASISATNNSPLQSLQQTAPSSRAPCCALQFDDTLTWADIEWVKSVWGGPMVVKGIMSAQDAVSHATTILLTLSPSILFAVF